MKENRPRPKNSFVPISFQPKKDTTIIKQDLNSTVKDKLKELIELYKRTTTQSQYSQMLAYRVIVICLTSNYEEGLTIAEQMKRFFNFCLKKNQLEPIRLCFDLLLLKQTKNALKEEQTRLFKIQILRALRDHYKRQNLREQRKKCGYTLEEYCKASLSRDCIKLNSQIYQQILDALIEEMKFKISRLVGRKNRIKAIDEMTSFVGVLEKSEKIVSSKYQEALMEAYWTLARLHDQMHYLAYTRKYASIALNIAKRIQNDGAVSELKALLDKLA